MVKIIKHGTRKTEECPKCGCVFSFEQEDIKRITNSDLKACVICPQCNAGVDVNIEVLFKSIV